jgi:hypothetical protein
MNVIRIRDSISSHADDEPQYLESEGIPIQEVSNPKMMKSEFRDRTKPIGNADPMAKSKNVYASSLR